MQVARGRTDNLAPAAAAVLGRRLQRVENRLLNNHLRELDEDVGDGVEHDVAECLPCVTGILHALQRVGDERRGLHERLTEAVDEHVDDLTLLCRQLDRHRLNLRAEVFEAGARGLRLRTIAQRRHELSRLRTQRFELRQQASVDFLDTRGGFAASQQTGFLQRVDRIHRRLSLLQQVINPLLVELLCGRLRLRLLQRRQCVEAALNFALGCIRLTELVGFTQHAFQFGFAIRDLVVDHGQTRFERIRARRRNVVVDVAQLFRHVLFQTQAALGERGQTLLFGLFLLACSFSGLRCLICRLRIRACTRSRSLRLFTDAINVCLHGVHYAPFFFPLIRQTLGNAKRKLRKLFSFLNERS